MICTILPYTLVTQINKLRRVAERPGVFSISNGKSEGVNASYEEKALEERLVKYVRAMLLGAAFLGGSSVWSAAQTLVPVQYQDRDDRQAFQQGYQQGQWDARHGRRADWDDNHWREGDDRRAYREGYQRGYREARGDGFRGEGFYGSDHPGYAEAPRKFGYQDGYSDGLHDRRTGHSFRPTHDDNYRHADRGYYPGFGSKNYYKDLYRQSYGQGYQQGYDNGWRR